MQLNRAMLHYKKDMQEYKTLKGLIRAEGCGNAKPTDYSLKLSKMKLGQYKVVKPVWAFSNSFRPSLYWIVKKENGKFTLLTNPVLVNLYYKYKANAFYFGVPYISKDEKKDLMSKATYIADIDCQKDKGNYYLQSQLFESDKKAALINFDENICYFKSLNRNEFKASLSKIISKYHFKEIKDVSGFHDCLYLLVLDKYKEYYVGKAQRLLNRTRKHWISKIDLKHIIAGKVSRLAIDSFRMHDTTRIFVCTEIDRILKENKEEDNYKLNKGPISALYYSMSNMDKAERIVINNLHCKFALNDRVALMDKNGMELIYNELSKKYKIKPDNLKIKHYHKLSDYKEERYLSYLNDLRKRHKNDFEKFVKKFFNT